MAEYERYIEMLIAEEVADMKRAQAWNGEDASEEELREAAIEIIGHIEPI